MKNRPRALFYGHAVDSLFIRIITGILSPLLVLLFFPTVANAQSVWLKLVVGWLTLLFMPEAAYSFLEIKHLLLHDGIAEGNPRPAVVVFLIISTIGLLGTVASIIIGAWGVGQWYGIPHLYAIAALSFLTALGAVMGLADRHPILAIVFPPILFYYLFKLVQRRRLALLTLPLALGLFCLSLAVSALIL